jgi:hypothetical protein
MCVLYINGGNILFIVEFFTILLLLATTVNLLTTSKTKVVKLDNRFLLKTSISGFIEWSFSSAIQICECTIFSDKKITETIKGTK